MNTGINITKTHLLGILGILNAFIVLIPNTNSLGQANLQIDELTERKILNATIQINMYVLTNWENLTQTHPSVEEAHTYIDQGRGNYRVEGLGTLIDFQGHTLILTHDHWGDMPMKADLIEILDTDGNILSSMNNLEFRTLMYFSDSGSMILKASEGLGGDPIQLGDSSQVSDGQEIILARRQPGVENQVDLIVARVKNNAAFKNQAAWELRTLSGDHLLPGDSGGGVWLDGQVVGNNWAIEMVENGGFLGITGSEKAPNGTVYAAQYPIDIQPQLEENLTNLTAPGLVENTESRQDRTQP